MTVKEFYEWAKKNNCVYYSVEIQHRDDGGYYDGTSDLEEDEIRIDRGKYGHGIITI